MLARIALIIILLTGALQAQTLDQRLLDLSAKLDSANRLQREGGGLNMDELNEIAAELETVISEMRRVERDFSGERKAIEESLFAQSENLMETIGFITTFESQSAPDYFLHPQGSLASVQANIILEGVFSELQSEVAGVASELKAWRDLEAKEVTLRDNSSAAFQQINLLRDQIIETNQASNPERTTNEPMVLDALYAVSENLEQFVNGLEDIEMSGNLPPSFSMNENAGTMPLPVTGAITPTRQGISISTSDQFVKSPIPGTVRFHANFLDYGETVIIEPENDFLVVIAGMDSVAVKEGDIIAPDQVIGFFNTDQVAMASPTTGVLHLPENNLYVETRYKSNAVNSMEYFREKVN